MKQNYKLILLKDGRNILVSDELTNIEAQEIEHYQTYDRKFFRIISGTERTPTLTYADKVKEFLKTNHGWVDVVEYKLEDFEHERKKVYLETGSLTAYSILDRGISLGFKAHQSITNKRFSLEDMKNFAVFSFKNFAGSNVNDAFDKWQSLQQPIELNVEVEMEQICKMCNSEYLESGCAYSGCGVNGILLQPKITSNSILITKIL